MQALQRILGLVLVLVACNSGDDHPPGAGAPSGEEGGAAGADASGSGTPFTGWVRLSHGQQHVCGLSVDSLVYCWGGGTSGQLGSGDDSLAGSALPLLVPSLRGVTSVLVGYDTSCALLDSGEVDCWGKDWGVIPNTTSSVPIPVPGITDATQIAFDFGSGCAVHADGTVSCWGNAYLGDGKSTASSMPVAVEGLTDVTAITVGANRTFAIRSDGSVMGWGDNRHGELGLGTTTDELTPVPIPIAEGATQIASGAAGTCAIMADGSVMCWGYSGQQTIAGVADATAVSVGEGHSCAIAGGVITCWGSNAQGQLGNGVATPTLDATPVTVQGIATAVTVTAGHTSTCATLADHTARCWGIGPLGSVKTSNSPAPIRVEPPSP